jgi:hypothetical protein
MKNDASKMLGERTKKQRDTLEFCKLDIESTCNNLWVRWATLIGISLVLLHHAQMEGSKPLLIRSATTT